MEYAWILCYSDSQIVIDLTLKYYNMFHYYATVIVNIQDMMLDELRAMKKRLKTL
jgi:hypothetical protein